MVKVIYLRPIRFLKFHVGIGFFKTVRSVDAFETFQHTFQRWFNKRINKNFVFFNRYETHTCELGLRKNDIVDLGYLQLFRNCVSRQAIKGVHLFF